MGRAPIFFVTQKAIYSTPALINYAAQCIDELTKAGADKKTMAALDRLRDLHRNPIDHPEEFLELPEALEVFNAATVAICKMARQIAALRQANRA